MSGKVTTKLFIGNLPDMCRKQELQTKFEKFGDVVEFDIISNYGFAHFEKQDEARAAADALNGIDYNGKPLRVELSHSKVRQKPGMGNKEECYRCGKEGHWSKDCPRGPRRPRPDFRGDPYGDEPFYRDPYDDPYLRSRYPPPPPPSLRRYDPYYDPYDRRPLPPPRGDPYLRERLADPYARVDPYYYERRPESSERAGADAARDPYPAAARPGDARDPYAAARAGDSRDPYAAARPGDSRDPYAAARPGDSRDPYAAARPGDSRDPYAAARSGDSRDPYASARPGDSKDPYAAARPGNTRDPYDDYVDRRAYAASARPSPYSKPAAAPSTAGYPGSTSSGYPAPASSGFPTSASSSYPTSSSYPVSSNFSSSASSRFGSSTVQSSRVPGPY